MNRVIGAIILVLVTVLPAVSQELPFDGKVKSVSANSDVMSLDGMKAVVAKHGDNSDVVWLGYQITVREAFKGLINRDHSAWHSHRNFSTNKYAVALHDDDDGIWLTVSPEKGILFKFVRKDGGYESRGIEIYDLKERIQFSTPLLWLGKANPDDSLNLANNYLHEGPVEYRDDAIPVIALHPSEKALTILEKCTLNNEVHDLREDALLWYGLALEKSDLERFSTLYRKLDDSELREDSLFLFHHFGTDESTKILFELASADPSEDVREQAVFWLGQGVGKHLAKKMGVNPDLEEDMSEDQRAKIFALYQMDNARGRQMLERVVREGKTFQMRKQALFWLCTDPDDNVLKLLKELMQ